MVKLQVKSDRSGVWDVEQTPTGQWAATHEDIDGALDSGDDRVLYGNHIFDLIHQVQFYDEEINDGQ